MKNVKTPFLLRKEVVTVISIGFGAILGGLLSSIGQDVGKYHGIKETNEEWNAAVSNLKNELERDIDESEEKTE